MANEKTGMSGFYTNFLGGRDKQPEPNNKIALLKKLQEDRQSQQKNLIVEDFVFKKADKRDAFENKNKKRSRSRFRTKSPEKHTENKIEPTIETREPHNDLRKQKIMNDTPTLSKEDKISEMKKRYLER